MKTAFSTKDFINTKWFILEKIIQLITGIVIVPKIFNTLGTIDIGKLKFAESVVGIFSPLFFLGLSAVCIREIVFHPKRSAFILATAFYLRLISWIVVFIGVLICVSFIKDAQLVWLYIIISLSYLFRLTDVFEYYILALKWSKIIFITKISSLIVIVALQYYGVKNQFNVSYFAKVIAFDLLIQGSIYILFFLNNKKIDFKQWKFSVPISKLLIKMSFPLIVSNLLISFYITIDELFLKYYFDDHANGIFASVQFLVITLTWSIGFSILNALYPSLAESYQKDMVSYNIKLKVLLKTMTALGLIIGIFYTLFGNFILVNYFNQNYIESQIPLKIFCWAPLFIFIGMIYEKHLLNTNQLQNNVYRFALGCLVNLILSYMLIPYWYVNGAAIAVLTSHFITNVAYVLFDKKSRIQFISIFN
jgi:O-antigen/teichoic acid export membrane protein